MIIFASPPFWIGLFLVAAALLRVRQRDKFESSANTIFHVPCYPWTVLLFMATCAWMTWSSLVYAYGNLTFVAAGVGTIFVAGVVLSLFSRRKN